MSRYKFGIKLNDRKMLKVMYVHEMRHLVNQHDKRDWVIEMRQREAFEGLEMMECTM